MWSDILITVITVSLPLLLTYALKILEGFILSKSENEKINCALCYANDIISAVVDQTTQTFVKEIKKKGEWNRKTAIEAFNKSRLRVLEIIDNKCRGEIEKCVCDFNLWLDAKIEQSVKESKK